VSWFQGGELNVSYNCIDRHLDKRGDKVAFLWEPDNPDKPHRSITYKELYLEVNRFANVLKKMGLQKGDRVIIYMPMIPETAYAMLACTRIGVVHSVVFAGFSPEAIADRANDCGAKMVLTADVGYRAGKTVPLKENVDVAINKTSTVEKVLVVKNSDTTTVKMNAPKDFWYHELVKDVQDFCPPTSMKSEDPLFILYTSGSTNKPKGVLHSTAGYLMYASITHQYVFDYKESDVYWCSADVGWVTGHSYIVYGPLSNGATSVMFEGVPNYPTPSRFWEVIDKHQVNVFYTAPTAIRSLMREGDSWVKNTKRNSLRLLGSVGEPINPEAWLWYYNVVGNATCPIVDTWWQTETGATLIVPLPGAIMKPGAACYPFFGVKPKLLTPEGAEIKGAGEGVLAIEDSWPGQMTTIFGNHDRFEETYFSLYKGLYFTGDGCRRDEDGCYWITGRVDDVINVSGHRIGTAEVESAFVGHHKVAEAAVVGMPHDIKGQAIYAYVTLKVGENYDEALKKELVLWVRKEIGPFAAPEVIQWAPRLPKTRSGKIMRRILRKIAEGQHDSLGDVTTLSDPSVVDELVANGPSKTVIKKAA
jgi:acetyl-CoA synthetase